MDGAVVPLARPAWIGIYGPGREGASLHVFYFNGSGFFNCFSIGTYQRYNPDLLGENLKICENVKFQ